jgi:hypothetical protein
MAPFSLLACPHRRPDGSSCGNNILGRIKFPPGWNVYPLPLKSEDQASGDSPVKQCRDCKGWVEIVMHARPAQ